MIRTVACVAGLLAAGAAQAQVAGEAYSYDVGGESFEGYVARNTDLDQSLGTVLIVHDWDGLTDYERRRAEMLAALGYTAFAIDVYGADTNPQSTEDNRRLSSALYNDRDTFRQRLEGSIAAASEIPGATDNRIIMGYCFGGAAVLQAARANMDVDGFVSFHGGLGTPEGQDYSATEGPILVLHGSADPNSGMDAFATLMGELVDAGVTHDAQVYGGAEHSFTVWGSDDYDLDADRRSWAALTEFLDDQL